MATRLRKVRQLSVCKSTKRKTYKFLLTILRQRVLCESLLSFSFFFFFAGVRMEPKNKHPVAEEPRSKRACAEEAKSEWTTLQFTVFCSEVGGHYGTEDGFTKQSIRLIVPKCFFSGGPWRDTRALSEAVVLYGTGRVSEAATAQFDDWLERKFDVRTRDLINRLSTFLKEEEDDPKSRLLCSPEKAIRVVAKYYQREAKNEEGVDHEQKARDMFEKNPEFFFDDFEKAHESIFVAPFFVLPGVAKGVAGKDVLPEYYLTLFLSYEFFDNED